MPTAEVGTPFASAALCEPMSEPHAPRSAAACTDHEPPGVEPFPAFRGRVGRLLDDLEADRRELELAITDGAARRMLLCAHDAGEPATDDPLRAEAEELDGLMGRLRCTLDARGR